MFTQTKSFGRTKRTCYFTYLATSSAFVLPALLFTTFREMYGVSYTLLGTLVLTNFFTQMTIDLVFTFFAKHFPIRATIRLMPLLTSAGLLIYAASPLLFPRHVFAGLLIGTVIFSVAAGLCEVLLSPLVAALPSDNPARDMSALHSLYAYGVISVVGVSSLFFRLFGTENWMYLTVFWALLPVVSSILFSVSPIPEMDITQPPDARAAKKRNAGLMLFALCIFLGSAAENTMTNWISGYMESSLHLSKTVGDVVGLALFAVLLAFGRTAYAKWGKNIFPVLLCGMAGAAVCYLAAGLAASAVVSVIACALTGLCTSMLWPGTLILMEDKIPAPGVTAYALMAAGGDMGGALAPQLMGGVVDAAAASGWAARLHEAAGLSTEQIGMRFGMLVSAVFPILGVLVLLYIRKYHAREKR